MDTTQSMIDTKLKLTMSLRNAQSIKNKELLLHGQLIHHDVDICILTETWLSDSDLDRTWLQYTVLNKVPYQMFTSNRTGRKGGGVALISKSHLRVKQIGEGQLRSFQFCKWQVQVHHTSVTLVSIYHLPYNNKTKVTNADFMDEYTDWLAETSANDKNLVICGDYNMHVNNPDDEGAASFLETNEALGLMQHVTFATHSSGNTLDLIFTEINGGIGVADCVSDSYISDHCNVLCKLSIRREDIQRKTVKYRKLTNIDTQEMAKHIKAATSSKGNLDDRVRNFNNALTGSLDVVAPVQTKHITIQRTVPWYTDDARDLKKCMRRRETIWRKYKRDDTWLAFKVVRSKYRAELHRAKREILSDKVRGCGNDTRKLYALVNALTGVSNNVNPLPDCNNYEQLAEEFANHFMAKIKNIRDSLDRFPKYNPPIRHTPKLTQFNRLTVDEVQEMVNNMQAKACDSDAIPAKVFKEIAPLIIDQITEVVNISLTEGDFATSWKVATIKPLLKKPSLEPVLKNY